MTAHRMTTHPVSVGAVRIGGGAPVAVQAMTDTDTADAAATAAQCRALADAGAEIVRITVDRPEAAQAIPEIRKRLQDTGCPVSLVGDFHYQAHRLLRDWPDCAAALDKYRVNPGNIGNRSARDAHFETVCAIANEHGKPIRIGVNGGSLDRALVTTAMEENARLTEPKSSRTVIADCAVTSALASVESARTAGVSTNRIVVSAKISSPRELINANRRLAASLRQPIHLGLTEAGIGMRGLVWSAAAIGTLLEEGIGDTIRLSVTPSPYGDRQDEVRAACELLQALGLRSFSAAVHACPGCGRTAGELFRTLADRVQAHLVDSGPEAAGVTVAVMGCVVNGPGESRSADIGISLPGRGEEPRCPVYVDGEHRVTLRGDADALAEDFITLIDEYLHRRRT